MHEKHVPIVTGNHLPFRLILRDDEDVWKPTLDQINSHSYDYVKLHRASIFIDVNIAPFSLVVCFDGTLVLPAIETYRDPDAALTLFNRFLCEALVGGIYCEAMSPDDICLGAMTQTAYCKITSASRGAASAFHMAIRTKHIGALDAIKLFQPETLTVSQLQKAIDTGRARLSGIGITVSETLLHGITFFVRNQWTEALIHLWTTIEQLLDVLWQANILNNPSVPGVSRKRRRAFLEDHRTWTASSISEVLYQKGLLPPETYGLIDCVRAARNAFVHSGVPPSRQQAEAGLSATIEMASLRLKDNADKDALRSIVGIVKSRSQSYKEWDRQGEPIVGVTHWLSIPPLPGDETWGDKSYEVIMELKLQPIANGKSLK